MTDLKQFGLEPLADTIICGARLGQQQLYYKAEDVQALMAKLTAPLADAELAELAALKPASALPWKSGRYLHDNAPFVVPTPYVSSPSLLTTRNGSAIFRSEVDADYLVAAANALPGLLARLAAETPQWASVSKPPQRKQNVLVLLTTDSQVTVTYKGADRWDTGLGTVYEDKYVVSWQPLPAAPAQMVEGSQPSA